MLQFIYKSSEYFRIPDFQRPYTWVNWQTETVINDLETVVQKMKNEKTVNHYFGALVYVNEDDHYTIIDGQQRLTTVLLMLTALYHLLLENTEKSKRVAQDIKEKYLSADLDGGERKIILKTVTTDNDIFTKIFEQKDLSEEQKSQYL
ncbi:MAG: DUF262 domain-containing protein [Endomicrobium sp.]|nr:DUF262 domain-containing protein [Endomicrobium sp.]